MSNCNQTIRTLKAGVNGIARQTQGRSRSWGGKKPHVNDYVEAMIHRHKNKFTVLGIN